MDLFRCWRHSTIFSFHGFRLRSSFLPPMSASKCVFLYCLRFAPHSHPSLFFVPQDLPWLRFITFLGRLPFLADPLRLPTGSPGSYFEMIFGHVPPFDFLCYDGGFEFPLPCLIFISFFSLFLPFKMSPFFW